MKCLLCMYDWKREKLKEYISFFSKCPNCDARFPIIRNDLLISLFNFLSKFFKTVKNQLK